MSLSDTALLAAEEAYDTVIRAENTRSPYMNTRAFRAAFEVASTIEARRAATPKSGAVHESVAPKGGAQ